MSPSEKPLVVALEEHYWDPDLLALFPGREGKRVSDVEKRLLDTGELRLREMDEAGIDVQVISHGAPGTQKLDAETSIRMARQCNTRLSEFVATNSKRFSALCLLPTPDPTAAASELERAVTKLGMKGAMIHGLTNGKFVDEPHFWPIFERAQALDVPIYIHPAFPSSVVIEAYYKEYAASYSQLIGPALGFTVEALTQAVRLVISGVFEKYPKLKIILGHLGEGIPFLLWRIDQFLPRTTGSAFKDIFRNNFYLTTSGNFSDSALTASITEMGIDRIMFSVDWPFNSNKTASDWLNGLPLNATDKAKLAGLNAKALLKL
jgi:predicted TIM-barrel fold metal-dependent hydrolase